MAIRKIIKNNTELVSDPQLTYLTAAAVGGTTSTLTVVSNSEIAENQILLIGEFGEERSEVVKTHATDAATGTTDIILTAAVANSHPVDTPIYIIDYNQIKFAHATTATGTKTVLGTEGVEADNTQTIYKDKTKNSGFYFKKYYNNITGTFTAATTGIITSAGHGLSNGETISKTTTDTLPAGLTVGVVYYVINSTTDTYKVALTNGGTAVVITDTGTGTHTWGRCGLWSDAEPYGNFDEDTVYSIKQRALDGLGEKLGGWLTSDWLNERLWEARRLVHAKRKRWSWRQSFDTDLGNVVAGDYRVAMPTDMGKDDTPENIVGLRIGTSQNLTYITKKEMDEEWESVARTTLASDYAIVDASVTLTDSRDIDESGSIQFNDEETLKYSANAESTGILTVSTAATSAHSAAVNVYQNANFSLPDKFTIYQGYIYFNHPIDADYVDQNYWIDYYKALTEYDSEGDELDEPEFDFYVHYLKFQIKHRQSQGKLKMTNDSDGQLFLSGVGDLIRKEMLGQSIQFIPQE
uniref:Putative tail collar protein n=1 Tax=viral metagenome TaxID=1070528 RepID=A0A6H1ZGF0_9ZZZZ